MSTAAADAHVAATDGGAGWTVWLDDRTSGEHVIRLKGVAAVGSVGSQRRLRLSVPRATMSELQLTVPAVEIAVEVTGDGILESVRANEEAESSVMFVVGIGGPTTVGWEPAQARATDAVAELEADTQLLVHIDGRSVTTDAEIVVRTLSGAFESLQVRLPEGAEWIPNTVAGMRVTKVADEVLDNGQDGEAGADAGQLLEIRLDEKTSQPVTIRLLTERLHDPGEEASFAELAGFDVIGAIRQGGHVGVYVEGDWRLDWGDRRHVRQTNELPEDWMREGMLAGVCLLSPAVFSVGAGRAATVPDRCGTDVSL